jgi:hypothetical protein
MLTHFPPLKHSKVAHSSTTSIINFVEADAEGLLRTSWYVSVRLYTPSSNSVTPFSITLLPARFDGLISIVLKRGEAGSFIVIVLASVPSGTNDKKMESGLGSSTRW